MRLHPGTAGVLLAATVAVAGCTTTGPVAGHPSSGRSSAPRPDPAGGVDSLVVLGDDSGSSASSAVASFFVRNVDAGAIVVSPASGRQVRLPCPGYTTVQVPLGDRSRLLTVRQARTGQVLLQTPIQHAGVWYVLARRFGALISREEPASIGPASMGCLR